MAIVKIFWQITVYRRRGLSGLQFHITIYEVMSRKLVKSHTQKQGGLAFFQRRKEGGKQAGKATDERHQLLSSLITNEAHKSF